MRKSRKSAMFYCFSFLLGVHSFEAMEFSREKLNKEYKMIDDTRETFKDKFDSEFLKWMEFKCIINSRPIYPSLSGNIQIAQLKGDFSQEYDKGQNNLYLHNNGGNFTINLLGGFIGSYSKSTNILKLEELSGSYRIFLNLGKDGKQRLVYLHSLFWKGPVPSIALGIHSRYFAGKMDFSGLEECNITLGMSTHGEIELTGISKRTPMGAIKIYSFFIGDKIKIEASRNMSKDDIINLEGKKPVFINFVFNICNSKIWKMLDSRLFNLLFVPEIEKSILDLALMVDIYINDRLAYERNDPDNNKSIKVPYLSALFEQFRLSFAIPGAIGQQAVSALDEVVQSSDGARLESGLDIAEKSTVEVQNEPQLDRAGELESGCLFDFEELERRLPIIG